MKKQLVLLGIIILFFIKFSGCIENDTSTLDDKLFGTWSSTEAQASIIIFNSNGSCTLGDLDGTWSIQDDKLVVITGDEIPKTKSTYVYSFSDNNQTLKLVSVDFGNEGIFIKQ